MRFCEECGAKLEDNARFCEECGSVVTPLEKENPVVTEATQSVASVAVAETVEDAGQMAWKAPDVSKRVQEIPAQAVTPQTAPVQTAAPQAAPVQTAAPQAAQVQTAAPQAAPKQAVPAQAAAPQAAPKRTYTAGQGAIPQPIAQNISVNAPQNAKAPQPKQGNKKPIAIIAAAASVVVVAAAVLVFIFVIKPNLGTSDDKVIEEASEKKHKSDKKQAQNEKRLPDNSENETSKIESADTTDSGDAPDKKDATGDSNTTGDSDATGNSDATGDSNATGDEGEYGDPDIYGDEGEYGNPDIYGDEGEYGNLDIYGDEGEYGDPDIYGDEGEYGDPDIYGDEGEYGDPDIYDYETGDYCTYLYGPEYKQIWRESDLSYVPGYLIPDSHIRKLCEEDLYGFTQEELRIARNEIMARHGRKFTSADLQQHFDSCYWYSPIYEADKFPTSLLNEIELANVDFIKAYEDSGKAAQSRYYQTAANKYTTFVSRDYFELLYFTYYSDYHGVGTYSKTVGDTTYWTSFSFEEDENGIISLRAMDGHYIGEGFIYYFCDSEGSYICIDIPDFYGDSGKITMMDFKGWDNRNI